MALPIAISSHLSMELIKDKVWEDLCRYHYKYKYACHNLSWQKTLRKSIKIITLLFSTGGILGWSIWKEGSFLIISYVITSVVQLISLLENNIVLSDEGFEKLIELQSKLKLHFDRLELLYYEFNMGHIKDEKKATKRLLIDFKVFENEIDKLDSSMNSWEPKFLLKRTLPDYNQFVALKTK